MCIHTFTYICHICKDIIRQDHHGSLEHISYPDQIRIGRYATYVYITWYTDMNQQMITKTFYGLDYYPQTLYIYQKNMITEERKCF